MKNRKIPIGKCPVCNSTVIYSDNGADKKQISVVCVNDDYKGHTHLCAKCKTMVAVIEKHQIVIPIIGVINT